MIEFVLKLSTYNSGLNHFYLSTHHHFECVLANAAVANMDMVEMTTVWRHTHMSSEGRTDELTFSLLSYFLFKPSPLYVTMTLTLRNDFHYPTQMRANFAVQAFSERNDPVPVQQRPTTTSSFSVIFFFFYCFLFFLPLLTGNTTVISTRTEYTVLYKIKHTESVLSHSI